MIGSLQTNEQFNAIVFENRNRSYGAFELRNLFARNQIIGVIIASLVLFLSVLLFYLQLQYFDNQGEIYEDIDYRSIEYSTEIVILPTVVPDNAPPKGIEKPTIEDAPPIVVEDTKQEEKPKDEIKSETKKTEETGKIGQKDGTENGKGNEQQVASVSNDTIGSALYTNEIFMKVDVGAEFSGGKENFAKFLRDNIKYPDYAIQNKVNGIVFVHIVINRDGSLQDLRLYKGIEQTCNEEVMRVIKLMPDWIPARKNGINVRQRLIIPVNFNATQ